MNCFLLLFFACTMFQIASAKSFMPALDRMRKKVENALATIPAQSPQELIKIGSTHCINALNQQSNNDVVVVEKKINSLYWSQLIDFVKTLTNTVGQSREQARSVLLAKIKERYADVRSSLSLFMQD